MKKPRAPSTIRRRAYSTIQKIPEQENRFILLGVSSAARPLVVIHCCRESDSMIRIISARKATKKEVRFYEEEI